MKKGDGNGKKVSAKSCTIYCQSSWRFPCIPAKEQEAKLVSKYCVIGRSSHRSMNSVLAATLHYITLHYITLLLVYVMATQAGGNPI
jgi:hypothetical protein